MDNHAELTEVLGPALVQALSNKGFENLTSVQEAVLAPELSGRDLRISSQTGSGKTVALGFVIRDSVAAPPAEGAGKKGAARPGAIIVTPTRELAQQVERELSWLFAPIGAGVVSVTGGASYRDEMRSFASGPRLVVGTPGRLVDHLQRGTLDASGVSSFVLDEADRMLDMGFTEDLDAIVAHVPAARRTHLVSATFPREVLSLAKRIQTEPVSVEGTRLGTANTDIEHVLFLIEDAERFDVLVNILLADPDAQTLVFARTRADVGTLAKRLSGLGFAVGGLSGEMEQRARNKALAAFKKGQLRALVATDVAARGIDVQDITQVLHFEPPNDADTYTHRSGRTGRAGKKGMSAVLVNLPTLPRVREILRRAGVGHRFESVPTRERIEQALDDRILADVVAPAPEGGFPEPTWMLAKRIAEAGEPAVAVARLLMRVEHRGPTLARDVTLVSPPPDKPARRKEGRPDTRGPRPGQRDPRPDSFRPPAAPRDTGGLGWVTFRVTWGEMHGADARRLLAMVCRRGGVQSGDIGAIHVSRLYSLVDVATDVAEGFAESASKRDPRDPKVQVRRNEEGPAGQSAAAARTSERPPAKPHRKGRGGPPGPGGPPRGPGGPSRGPSGPSRGPRPGGAKRSGR